MKFGKLVSLILAGAMTFSVCACAKKNDTTGGGGGNNTVTAARQTVTEEGQYQADYSKLLHKVNVTESSRKLVDGETTEYKLVIPEGSSAAGRAATFIQGHLRKATGVDFDIVTDAAADPFDAASSKYIVIGSQPMFEASGLTMPADDLGQSGYYIKTVGDSVIMMGSTDYSYQHIARAFLYHVLGYVMYSQDTVFYEKEDCTTLPDMDIIEKPDFDFKTSQQPMPDDLMYGMGFLSTGEVFLTPNGAWVHNSLDYLESYKTSHPDWFAGNQLCYTAHGNESEYNAMVQAVADIIVRTSDANPSLGSITFTQEDGGSYCTCDNCRQMYAKYTNAGVQAMFMNDVDDLIRPRLNGRPLNIIFFAYNDTAQPPVKKGPDGEFIRNAQGKFEPIAPEVICHPGVGVMIAPINSVKTNFTYPFSNNENSATQNCIEGWQECCSLIYYWLYETNFHYYMYPYNTWDAMVETYRYCVDSGAEFVFSEGQVGQHYGSSSFTRFKEYINSQAMFDVSVEYSDLVKKYFPAYFGEAAPQMYEMFEDICVWMRYLEEAYPTSVSGYIYDDIGASALWPKGKLDNYLALIDSAFAAIAPLEETDPDRYSALYDHILQESLFPRYALIDLYENYFSAGELLEMRTSFKADASRLGCSNVREGGSFSGVYTNWGV